MATNAAESSVTIPDCDVVICLGTHKSLQYSALNHRTQLVNTWYEIHSIYFNIFLLCVEACKVVLYLQTF